MKKLGLVCLLLLLLALPGSALAQTYSFSLNQESVQVFWNADGSLSIDYLFTFTNDAWASPIDFVDVGLPNANYEITSIFADVDGNPIDDIEVSPYVTHGVAVGLGANAIPPGKSGTVHAFIGTVNRVLYPDDQDDTYASAVFSPTWFGSEYVSGTTDLTVTFHLPPGIEPQQPRWHAAPAGFPSEPETGLDPEGRVTYTWRNPAANGYTQYRFGASFPEAVVAAGSVVRPSPYAPFFRFLDNLMEVLPFIACFGIIVGLIVFSSVQSRRRQLQYLPPKISIEGHGIKRGLTAVEAAILMQEPMDKILTMILFAVIKKNAAQVKSRDPLRLEVVEHLPEGLRSYEIDFLNAFKKSNIRSRRKDLREMMLALVKQISKTMKGFSRKETMAYYKSIIERAWSQVEAADTPEVKSQKYNELMEWTMLDRNYERKTRDVFRSHPVLIPTWWARYDPVYRAGTAASAKGVPGGKVTSAPSGGLPHLPGSDFAASIVNGVETISAGAVGNIVNFTRSITNKTNPIPKSTSSGRSGGWKSGGGGHSSCACACACAGCACACAGGGR